MRTSNRILVRLVLVLTCSIVPLSPARADEPTATLVPPRVVEEVTPPYPEGATGEAQVLLEVVVEQDGTTGAVSVVDGAEPFASAAVEAVRRYRFEPARRAEHAVRSRIRIAVLFTPPPPTPPPPAPETGPAAPAAASPPPPAPPPNRVEEVTIAGNRRPTATPDEHRIGRADVRVLPGAFGDPFRAIEMLPGVVPTISGLPYYYIRGAPPSAVGYYVDEVRVPYLFHFALGPGVIQPALIDEVSLFPAAFPGRYGRFSGAIVAGKTREPASEVSGEGNIRLFDAGAYVEAPFAGGKGAAGVGGRYSYTAALFSLFVPNTTIDYRDYNARASYEIADRWRATAFAFGSYDYASQIDDDTKLKRVLFASEFHRLDLRLDHTASDGATTRIAMTFGIDRSRIEAARFAQDFVFGLRGRHRAPLSREVDVEVGADLEIDRYSGDLPSPYAVTPDDYQQAVTFFSPRVETATGVWASASWHPTSGFDLTATARADLFTSAGKIGVGPSPRASMRVPLAPRLAFLGELGVAPQPPAFAIPVPAIGYSGLPGGLSYGYQESAGVELQLPLRMTSRVVGFHHAYFNLRDFARDTANFDVTSPQALPHAPTEAYGLEVSVNRKLSERLGGFLSYTLSRSVLGSDQFAPERISPFDRTHVFQLGTSFDAGAGWRLGARFLTYTGWPDQGIAPATQAGLVGSTGGRLKPFVRVDGRIEKQWAWRKTGHISLILEVLNATASEEVVGRDCDQLGCHDSKIGPITVPSIGVEGAL